MASATSQPPALSSIWAFIKETFWLGQAEWSPKDMPDLTGKVVLVTGGNAGLGYDTIKVSTSSICHDKKEVDRDGRNC